MGGDPKLDLTALVNRAATEDESDPPSAEQILPVVYQQLRKLAASFLRGERAGHTLATSDLVHEAYMRLVDQERVRWRGRTHFLAVAAQAMRRILVDHARHKGRLKRGGGAARVTFSEQILPAADAETGVDLGTVLDLDQALSRLAELDPRQAALVELRFFGGCTVEEAAAQLGVSQRTAEDDWTHAKAWLRRELARYGRP